MRPPHATGVTRREALRGVALLAAAEKLADGGLAPVSPPGEPHRVDRDGRPAPVYPPGARPAAAFRATCIGCGRCSALCPGETLVPSTAFATFGQPTLSFKRGHCLLACTKCGEVCPTGAIRRLRPSARPHVHMGHAVWKKDLCVRTTNGDACTACVRKCPVQAIHLVKGFPVVDKAVCIGCGACEHVCPARPSPAIWVKGFMNQKTVEPMSRDDLRAEMKARLEQGASLVVARSGVIVAVREGRGIRPLLDALDEGILRGAVVRDRVIGRAAAAICLVGGAREVRARLASRDALGMLNGHGVDAAAEEAVERILNRDKSDACPVEKAVAGLTDPAKMVEVVRKTLEKLEKEQR